MTCRAMRGNSVGKRSCARSARVWLRVSVILHRLVNGMQGTWTGFWRLQALRALLARIFCARCLHVHV